MWHPKTSDGKTSLDLALRGNRPQVAGLLRARGATAGSQSHDDPLLRPIPFVLRIGAGAPPGQGNRVMLNGSAFAVGPSVLSRWPTLRTLGFAGVSTRQRKSGRRSHEQVFFELVVGRIRFWLRWCINCTGSANDGSTRSEWPAAGRPLRGRRQCRFLPARSNWPHLLHGGAGVLRILHRRPGHLRVVDWREPHPRFELPTTVGWRAHRECGSRPVAGSGRSDQFAAGCSLGGPGLP